MKAIKSRGENNQKIPINRIKVGDYSTSYKELLINNNTNNKSFIKSKQKRIPTMLTSGQELLKRNIIKEFGIQEKTEIKYFDYLDYISKESCTSYYFGDEPIEQKAFICSICDNKRKNFICNYCHKVCHLKCRKTLKEIPKSLIKKEYLNIQKFSCYCSSSLKHLIDIKKKKELISCTMMELDRMLGIFPYHCYQHNETVCCICAVVCHGECYVKQLRNININEELSCQCKSDYHSNFNELALSFPLEQYKKVSNIDVWPVQILNILFYKGKTFDKMSQFFNRSLSIEINFNNNINLAIINKFQNLLELFSYTFNRRFKTYYYTQEIISTFEYEKLFSLIKHLEVNNAQIAIIKFRLLFILLFIHLRKDFRTIKSLTSNDFMCDNVIQRLSYKKLLRSKTILTEKIDEKYRITKDFPLKEFVLNDLTDLMIKGMKLISIEENQDEFEIGLKLICFLIKRLIFNREDLIILINSFEIFHSEFYEYITNEKNNIYSLINIFNLIVKICYMIGALYNDVVIEEFLNSDEEEVGKFIHSKSDYSCKLLSMILKNCNLISKHYKILMKPNLDKESEEEQKRKRKFQKHILKMRAKIISKTTGITTKMPENGGLFTEKTIKLHNESLALFNLADNSYEKQLRYITEEEFDNYYSICKVVEDKNIVDIITTKREESEYSNNILYNLKNGLEEGYYSLFTSSYIKEENKLNEKLKKQVLDACDKIKNNIEKKCKESYYNKLISNLEKKVNNNQFNEIEKIRRKILKDISKNISFANSPFLLIEEGRKLIIDNLMIIQVDESIFRGFFFLTNIHFPNIINHELIEVFFDFLYLFLLTRRGIMYLLTGKNIQVIQKLINRFRFDTYNKNVNKMKKRTVEFNMKSIKIVIHFLCTLTKFIRRLQIKTLKNHKALIKLKKSILSHFKNFVYHVKKENLIMEYKMQLKEGLEIFNNLFDEFTYNQYEEIKRDIIELFKDNPLNFLNPIFFQKWFDKSNKEKIPNFMEKRRYDLDYYYQFFEIVTRNSFFVYENDEEGKQNIELLIKFVDLENLSKLLNESPELITLSEKTILIKFIRTLFLLDHLNQVNYLKKYHLLGTKQYKLMIKNNQKNNNLVKQDNNYIDNNIYMNIHFGNNNMINYNLANMNYFNQQNLGVLGNNIMINNNYLINNYNNNFNNQNFGIINNDQIINKNNNLLENEKNINKDKYLIKLKNIENLIILINLYIKEIESFPNSIRNENNFYIQKYIKELVFAVHEISTTIYYNKNVFNKILPYYYKLVIQFILKKDIFIQILEDIDENKFEINTKNYTSFLNKMYENKDYKKIISRGFNVFDKSEIFRYSIKNIFEIYNKTNINKNYCLTKYLEIYDLNNEANFSPFSLLEVYDYEYFYEIQNNKKENIKKKKNDNKSEKIEINTLDLIRESYLEQFRSISNTAFLGILTGDSNDKRTDYGEIYVNLFQSFINSTQSSSFTNYRALLCIITKILFYHGEHIQKLFNGMAYDKYFFNNLNRELNYDIVQSIDLSQKYELCSRCAEVTDITKLTIKFLQLLGEGFNTQFHDNILRGIVKKQGKKKVKAKTKNYTAFTNEAFENEKEDESSDSDFDENNFLIENKLPELKKSILKKKEVPLVEPKCTIYETAILNLKRIYHLMEFNNLLEGESAFDKLCVLTSNIIDFIIEYIDTLKDLTYIIDNNIKKLFFGNGEDDKNYTGYSYMDKKGIFPLFTMRIKDDYGDDYEESFNKYKLRKTMMAYIKIKYFQLMKAYLLIGHKNEFIQILLKEHLGPIQLFGEILYYMKELINNLVFKDYVKYNHLLYIEDVNSYKDKLNELYMFEKDFRNSVEISLVFQICIIIAILEDTYKINMLRDHFRKELIEEKKEQNSFKDNPEEQDFSDEDEEISEINNTNLNEKKYIENVKKMSKINLFKTLIKNRIKDKINKNNDTSNINDSTFKESNIKFLATHTFNNEFHYLRQLNEENIDDDLYKKIKINYQKNKIKKIKVRRESNVFNKEKKKILEEENLNLNSKFSKAIYKFLDSLVLKIEVRTKKEDENSNKKGVKGVNFKLYSNELTKRIINFKKEDIILSNINSNDLYGNNLDNNIDYELNNEGNREKENENEKEENIDSGKKSVFFIRPYLSFHLSEQAKNYFLYNVNRTTATNKYRELVLFTDYFLFEMVYNFKYINNSQLLSSLSKISFKLLQCINFFFVLVENILLILHYYRDYSLSYYEYDIVDNSVRFKRFTDIIILLAIKLILVIFALIIWFYCKFIVTYERNAIMKEDRNFIFRQLGQPTQHIIHPTMVKYFREEGNLLNIMSLINKDISIFKMIKLGVMNTVILNIDINIFVFAFFLDILFLVFGQPLFLAFETVFLYGIFPSLVIIFKSFTEKMSTLFACLMFTYLIIYVYNYISIFYLIDAIDLGEVYEYESGIEISEKFCHSSIQCFLVLISYGTRAGGGIGDALPKISYKRDTNMFFARFAYDMTFYILIIMIMGNVTFSLIVDTYKALRDDTYKYENDRTNICFICQLTRDGCLLKNIDYNKHIKKNHNLWSYVYFLCYLHLYNASDFTRIETFVWDRLLEKDYDWIPINTDAGGDVKEEE